MSIPKRLQWMKPGMPVVYYSIIGDPSTGQLVAISSGPGDLTRGVGRSRNWVVWVKFPDEKTQMVSCSAIRHLRSA